MKKLPKNIQVKIISVYGSVGNYYNEIFQIFMDYHHFVSTGKPKLDKYYEMIERMINELEDFGTNDAKRIIRIIYYETEIFIAKEKIKECINRIRNIKDKTEYNL